MNSKNQNICFSLLLFFLFNLTFHKLQDVADFSPWKMILRSIGKYIHTANKHILTIIEHQFSKKEHFPENLEKYFHNLSQIRNSHRDSVNISYFLYLIFVTQKPYDNFLNHFQKYLKPKFIFQFFKQNSEFLK